MFISYFVYLGTFIVISLRGNIHVSLRCTKIWSPGIGTVSHWQPPSVHIFDTTKSLLLYPRKAGILWIMHVHRPCPQRFSCLQPTSHISFGISFKLLHFEYYAEICYSPTFGYAKHKLKDSNSNSTFIALNQ